MKRIDYSELKIKDNLKFDREKGQFRYRPDEPKKHSEMEETEILFTPAGIHALERLYDEFQPFPDDADRLLEDFIHIMLEHLTKIRHKLSDDDTPHLESGAMYRLVWQKLDNGNPVESTEVTR